LRAKPRQASVQPRREVVGRDVLAAGKQLQPL